MKLFVTRLGSQVGLCCLSLLFLLLCTSSGVVVSSSDSIPATVTAPRGSRWAWNGASVDTLARLLAVGDFDGFNQVLAQGVSIQLGDLPSVSVPILGIFTITIDLKNVYCQNIDIGDILTSYSQQRNVDNNNNNNTVDELSLRTLVQPFSMDCYANYAFRGLYRGSGVLTLQSRNNKVDVELGFQSPSFDLHPPTQTVLNTCDANIAIYNLEFSSGLERIVVEIFEDDVSNMVENQAESALCEDAGKLFGFLDGLLSTVNGALEDFMEEPLFPTDPLEPERNLEFPEGGGKDDILSLRGNGGGPIGSIVRDMIAEADIFLGDMVEDEDGNSDLAINNWLRNNLLAEDGSFSLDLNTVIYEGHDRLAKTEIELQAIRVYGLDTFTAFEPITTLGEYTLENRVAWEYLSVEVQIQANLTTSSLPDSLFVSTTPLTTLETLHLAVNVTDLDIGLALLIAANRMSIESTPVGGLLLAETLLPCVVAAMEDVGLSALNVSVGDLSEPEVDGFASPGFDRIMSTLIKAVFAMYKPSLLRSIPSAMDSTVRKLINEDYLEPLLNETCQEPTTTKSGSVDWRDLLLPPSEAEQLGGSGDSPMGNLAHWLKGVLMDRLVKVEEGNVLPEVNPIVVRPLTRAQSGVDGTLELEDDLIDVSTGLGDTKLEFTVTGVTVENLDTVRLPLEILEPTQQASVMRNELSMGLEDRPISLEVTLAVGLEGGFVPNGKSYNEIAIRTTVDSVELAAEISAWVSASAFMSLPLGDAMRPDCLMALLQSPNSEAPLSFSRFSTVLSALTLDVRCVECPGPGGVAVPELVKELLQPGVTELLAGRFAEVLASVAESESMEMLAENFINDAPRFCQSSADYSANATRSNLLSGVGFPQLTPVGVDTLFYSGIVAIWSGLVVLSEAQIDSLTEETNPLSAQDSFVPPNARLVDWTDLGNSTGLGSLADDAFDYINDYLTREVDNGDLGINSLLRDWLVDGSTLDLPVENFGFDLSGFVLAVDRIRASGLDSFRGFGGLRALGAQTLGIDMELAALEVEMDISARYSGSSSPPQSMTLRFGVENVTLSVALFAAIDVDKVGDLTIGSLLSSRHILPCALSTAYSLQIPSLKMSFDAFSGPTIAGLMDETASSVAQFLSSTSEVYRESIMEAFPKLIEGPVRNILTELLDDNTSDRSCSQLTAQDPSSYIDFRDLLLSRSESLQLGGAGDARHGDVVPLLWGLVKDEMLSISSNGLARVNELLIAPLTKAQSGVTGTLRIVDNLVSEQLSFATIKARLGLRVSDVHVENLDTVGSPLSLLKPLDNEGHVLNNVATIGVGKPVRFGARLFFSVGTESSEISNDVNVQVQAESLTILLELLLKLVEDAVLSFPLKDLTNVDCLLATLPAPSLDENGLRIQDGEIPFLIQNLSTSFANLGMNVSCIECSSPGFSELTERLSTQVGRESASDFVDGAVDFLTELLGGDFITLELDRLVANARMKCPHRPEYEPGAASRAFEPFDPIERDTSIQFLIALAVAVGCGILAVAIFLGTIRVVVRRRHRKWLDSLTDQRVLLLWQHQQNEKARNEKLNAATKSLFQSADIPLFARLVIPLIIIGNIGLFLSGHLSPAASVNASVTVAGDTYTETDFFEFSLASGTVNLWNAGGRELAILIFVFSGVWPYAKQLISLVLWFLPPSRVSFSRRENIYLWLDFLAKWSMVDVITIVITLVAFRVTIQSPALQFLPAKFYQIDLLLIPKLGFYANLTAQIVSQISSHFIIYYTRKVVREAKKHLHDEGRSAVQNSNEDIASNEVLSDRTTSESTAFQAEESLARHGYTRVHRGEKDSLVPRSFVNLMLCGVACVLTVFVVLGCSMPSFTAEMFGIFGLIVEAGSGFENDAKNDISLFRMIKILFEQAEFRDRVGGYIGLSTLSALLIATVLVVPLLQSAMLLYQWFLPMTKSKRKRVIVILEVLQAWQYTEVFALSVVAGSWQLGSLVHFDLLPEEDAQCFLVEASVSSGFFLMAAGAILLALLNTFVTNATKQYLMELPSATIVPAPPKMDVRDNIEPSPVLFTDRFRWLLGREDRGFSRSDQNGETEKDVAVFDDSMDFQAAPAATRLSCSSSDVDEGPQSPTHGPVKAIDLDA